MILLFAPSSPTVGHPGRDRQTLTDAAALTAAPGSSRRKTRKNRSETDNNDQSRILPSQAGAAGPDCRPCRVWVLSSLIRSVSSIRLDKSDPIRLSTRQAWSYPQVLSYPPDQTSQVLIVGNLMARCSNPSRGRPVLSKLGREHGRARGPELPACGVIPSSPPRR